MNIITYLKQPFPKAENKWKNIVLISLFVTVFLLVFQPFGIGQIENSKYLFICGFGLVTFFILVFDLIIIERLFHRFFKEKNWRLYKELFWLFCIISSIGLGNVLYVISFSGQHLSLAYLINFQVLTFAVAIFPITIFTISKHNYLLRKHTTSAKDVNNSLKTESTVSQENKHISLYSYNEKAKVEFDINNLYYIESKGNDIELNLNENKFIVSKTLRNTLKKALGYLADSPELVQCHRAYIVNLSKVNKVEGNSQGLVLKFENCDIEVPVSRSFVNSIKSKLS
jgi:uncharacterized lipoprotein NlpE involved in copper resistance